MTHPAPDIQSLRDLSRRIDEAFEAGATGQGRTLLESALAASRNNPAYREYFRAGAARYLAGDRGEQLRRMHLAADLARDDSFIQRNLGVCLSAGGLDEEALDSYDQALRLNPDDAVAMRKKGVSLSRLNRRDEAMMWFANALEANPDDSAAMRNLGVCLSKAGRNDEALAWFDRALAANPRDRAAMRQKGVGLSMLGRLDEALEWYDKALEQNPADIDTLVNKARTLIEKGDFEAAALAYERIIGLDSRNPYHYLERAIALAKEGRAAEAKETVDRAFAIPNPSESLRRGRSYWLKRLGLPGDMARRDAGGEYGDIARVMEKTWDIFHDDIKSFRRNIEEAKNNLNVFINSSGMFRKDRVFLLGARKWNSFTPSLPLGDEEAAASVGGGYFLSANGVGTVIDPGFDFLENFNAMGGRLADIHNIVVTHAHNDHTADLESLLTLFYQRTKQAAPAGVSGRNRRRPPVNLYINMGAFQKFSPMLNLRQTDRLGEVRVIAPGEEYQLGSSGIAMRVLPAHHDEIFSTSFAVGLLFTLPTRPAKKILFTGDTGLFPANVEITSENVGEMEIGNQYGIEPGDIDYLVPHLGSIGENELRSPDRQDHLGESFYPNHLGVQGLIRLITQLRPKYVFVSEFGEELKGFIALLMRLIVRCVAEIYESGNAAKTRCPAILPMDLFFFCDLAGEEIYCVRTESFEPLAEVEYKHLSRGRTSQFYYESTSTNAAGDEYLAMKKLEQACRTNNGPFSDKADRTHRMVVER